MRPIIAKSSHRGFTLMELMIAVAILLLVITGLLATFVSCMLLNQTNNNLVIATKDAQYVLEQVKGLAYTDIGYYLDHYNSTAFPNLDNEHVAPHYDDDTVANITEITVTITWDERQNTRDFSLTTKIAKTQQ